MSGGNDEADVTRQFVSSLAAGVQPTVEIALNH
jgi:hypothetical protein